MDDPHGDGTLAIRANKAFRTTTHYLKARQRAGNPQSDTNPKRL